MNDSTREQIRHCERFIAGREDALALPPEAAQFAYALVVARGVHRALEIGTSYGYSGLWIAAGLRIGGQLITIDISDEKHEVARGYFNRAGFSSTIQCKTGHASQIVAALDGPFDFVLNDADKENCLNYGRLVLPKLSPRGIILTDNTTSHADDLRSFCDWARSQADLVSAHIPIGSGMELTIKRDTSSGS